MKKTRVWIGIGASVLLTPSLNAAEVPSGMPSDMRSLENAEGPALSGLFKQGNVTSSALRLAASEGGEGGEGGEVGIDPEEAAADPVKWGVALGVIDAHYRAGLKAYLANNKEAGAEMFAHGFSEVYAEMEPQFVERGGADLGAAMQKAIEVALASAEPGQVESAVGEVLRAIDALIAKDQPTDATRAKIAAELADRAALQYWKASHEQRLEPYLDGLGFSLAAQHRATPLLASLQTTDKEAADALRAVLTIAGDAYPAAERPSAFAIEAGKFLAAASRAKIAVSRLN